MSSSPLFPSVTIYYYHNHHSHHHQYHGRKISLLALPTHSILTKNNPTACRMKFSSLTLLAAMVGLAFAQTFDDIPDCGKHCAQEALDNTGCDVSNIKCFCTTADPLALLACATNSCGEKDVQRCIEIATAICKP